MVGVAVNVMLLVPPSRVPLVLVHVPLKVCDNPLPRFRVPPNPFIFSPAPDTLPVKVAVPLVFVIETSPIVVKAPIL